MPKPTPLKHSDLFTKYNSEITIKSGNPTIDDIKVNAFCYSADKANPGLGTAVKDGKISYSKLEALLFEHIDSQAGIVTVLDKNEKWPTGRCYVRDATTAKPLAQRIDPDSPILAGDNMLLRSLAITRGIDHALDSRRKYFSDGAQKNGQKALYYANEQAKLKKQLSELVNEVSLLLNPGVSSSEPVDTKTQLKKIAAFEKNYNTELIKILHRNNLDRGLRIRKSGNPRKGFKNFKDYVDILNHYRNLASTIDAAASVQTIVHDDINDVTHIETAHPITVKTAAQQASLAVTRNIVENPAAENKNFHSTQKVAFQEANAAFTDRIANAKSRLPAQTRKTHAPTVKNGYIVHLQLVFHHLQDKMFNHWSLRCATPVYVGKGENAESTLAETEENCRQLMLAVELTKQHQQKQNLPCEELDNITKLHLNVLNTPLLNWEEQKTIVDNTRTACNELGHAFSNVPINTLGTLISPTEIAPQIAGGEQGKRTSEITISREKRTS